MATSQYEQAEQRLWSDAGVTPAEHRVHLARNDVVVRVQEVGAGPAVLFLHGGPGAAGAVWAYLAARLPDFRCLLLDRPGTGGSGARPLHDVPAIRREADRLVVDVLEALDIGRAHVVGSSHGSYVALLSAAAYPDCVDRTVHLGCPGFVAGMSVRAFDRVALLPGAHRLFGLARPNERALRKTFRQLGHGASLEAGVLSDAMIEWAVALQRGTDTMTNELATMANMGTFRRGFDPALTVGRDLLAEVRSPTSLIWGSEDPYGDAQVGRDLADALPDASFELMEGAGHLCWLDDVDRAAAAVQGHLLAVDQLTADPTPSEGG